MIEVEVKARASNTDAVRKRLDRIGARFIRKERQEDRIFGHDMFLDAKNMVFEGGIVARIRAARDKKTLEFKEVLRREGGLEIASELKEIDMGIRLLRKLGFRESFSVSKIRESYAYNDFSIFIDNVNRLGDFIEIEKMVSSPAEAEKARKDCLNLLESLLPNSKTEDRKYGDLIQEIINKERARA